MRIRLHAAAIPRLWPPTVAARPPSGGSGLDSSPSPAIPQVLSRCDFLSSGYCHPIFRCAPIVVDMSALRCAPSLYLFHGDKDCVSRVANALDGGLRLWYQWLRQQVDERSSSAAE
jgi:hypothetical protein